MKELEIIKQKASMTSTFTVNTSDSKQSVFDIIGKVYPKYDKAMQDFFSFSDSYDDQILKDIHKTGLETLEFLKRWISATVWSEGEFIQVYAKFIIFILEIINGYSKPEVIYIEKLKYMSELLQKLDEIAKTHQPVFLASSEYFQILEIISKIFAQVKPWNDPFFQSTLMTIASYFKESGEIAEKNLVLLSRIQNLGESKEVKYLLPSVVKPNILRIQNHISTIIKQLNLKGSPKKLSKLPVFISSLYPAAVRAQTLSDRWNNQTAENITVEQVTEVSKFLIRGINALYEKNDKSRKLMELITEVTDCIHEICLIFNNHPLLLDSWLESKYYRILKSLNQKIYTEVVGPINEVLLLQPGNYENKFDKFKILINILYSFFAVSKEVFSSTSDSKNLGFVEVVFRTADQALDLYLDEKISTKIFQEVRASKSWLYFYLVKNTLDAISMCFIESPIKLKKLYDERMSSLFSRLICIADHHKKVDMLESHYEELLNYIVINFQIYKKFPIQKLILSLGKALTSNLYPLNKKIVYYEKFFYSQEDKKQSPESQSNSNEFERNKFNLTQKLSVQAAKINVEMSKVALQSGEKMPENKTEIKDQQPINSPSKKASDPSKQIKIVEKQIGELKAKIVGLTKSNKETQTALAKKKEDIEKLQIQFNIANEQMAELKKQLENYKKQSSATELKHTNEISSYKDENDHLIAQIKSQENNIDKLNIQIEQQQAEIKEQKKTIEKSKSEMRTEKHSLQEARKEITALKGKNAQLKDQFNIENVEHTEALQAAEAQIAALQAELQKVKSENEVKLEVENLKAKLKSADKLIGQKNEELLLLLQQQHYYQNALAEYKKIVTTPVIVQAPPPQVILLEPASIQPRPQWQPGFTYASPYGSYNSSISEPSISQVGTDSEQEVSEYGEQEYSSEINQLSYRAG